MKVVIEIDEHSYNLICRFITGEGYNVLPTSITDRLFKEVVRGTPLPKGHGKIMDVDKIIKKMEEREEQLKDNRSMYETACVETALNMFGETIIEADKEVEENGQANKTE